MDPSGQDFGLTAIIAGAIIGALSSGAQSDWDGEAMLVGAVIGGVSGGVADFAGGWAASAAWSGTGTSATLAGGVIGGTSAGAVAGGLGAAYYGSDIGNGILKGAGFGALGGLAFGAIGAHYGNSWNPYRVAMHGLVGGGISELSGGDFGWGFGFSSGQALFAWSSQTMRAKMWAQSQKDPRNASGISAGHRGDMKKLGGGRYNAADPTSRSLLGGIQGQKGRFLWWDYPDGSWEDLLVESFAGPHDWLQSWGYDSMGNIKSMNSFMSGLHEVSSWVNVFPAAVFMASDVAPPYLPYTMMR